MPKKLKLGSINPGGLPFQLVLKSAIFSVLLFFIDYYWLAFFLFIFFAFYFYLRPHINNGRFIYSFLVLTVLCLIIFGQSQFLANRLALVLFFGAMFFILLGIKNLIFIRRQIFYYIVSGFLFLAVFLSFFGADKSELFIWKYLLAGLAVFLLSREFLGFFGMEKNKNNGENSVFGNKLLISLMSLVFAFLAMQMMWAVALLPMGFLNSSVMLLLFMLVLGDFSVNYFSGTLDRIVILRNATIFILVSLAIFAISTWSI